MAALIITDCAAPAFIGTSPCDCLQRKVYPCSPDTDGSRVAHILPGPCPACDGHVAGLSISRDTGLPDTLFLSKPCTPECAITATSDHPVQVRVSVDFFNRGAVGICRRRLQLAGLQAYSVNTELAAKLQPWKQPNQGDLHNIFGAELVVGDAPFVLLKHIASELVPAFQGKICAPHCAVRNSLQAGLTELRPVHAAPAISINFCEKLQQRGSVDSFSKVGTQLVYESLFVHFTVLICNLLYVWEYLATRQKGPPPS